MKHTAMMLMLLCLLSLGAKAQTPQRPRPRITFQEEVLDAGTLSASKKQRKQLKVKYTNTGDAPLLITKVESSCGCTTIDFPTTPLPPGKKGKLTVTFDASHLDERGIVGNLITIHYNNSSLRYTRIRVKANITD